MLCARLLSFASAFASWGVGGLAFDLAFSASFVSFGGGPDVPVVRAARDEGGEGRLPSPANLVRWQAMEVFFSLLGVLVGF